MANTMNFLLTALAFISLSNLAMGSFNIMDFGAKPNGRTDSGQAFLAAWAKACRSRRPASIYVPAGRFLLGQATFEGPCRNSRVSIFIDGTIVAPNGYSSLLKWMHFVNVNGLEIIGGTLDGRGRALWSCKLAGRRCPIGATSLIIAKSKNVLISGLTSINPELIHISIQYSHGVTLQKVKISAPNNSPNTDGVHVQNSVGVTVTGSTIRTGDDCVSMKAGVENVLIERVYCGPGHGISIGSLGNGLHEEGVQNITVKSVVFRRTQNGLRIKTWGRPTSGFVKGVKFHHVVMNNVQNPIIIDQNYCPGNVNCPHKSSGIKISGVSFHDIKGSSATKVAVKLDCSPKNPCVGVGLRDIRLTYGKNEAQSYCRNARGRSSRVISPPSCL
ncbi:polygalacturonase-like [Asparagus officinalis]|uniref:polygalacturonase-like n=1 Tax=Asparagus officinalis TaxID=4686 RepID=UPI00098E00B0|nr:polygalacturonase-like [Asparagus officinalis]